MYVHDVGGHACERSLRLRVALTWTLLKLTSRVSQCSGIPVVCLDVESWAVQEASLKSFFSRMDHLKTLDSKA